MLGTLAAEAADAAAAPAAAAAAAGVRTSAVVSTCSWDAGNKD